MFNEPGVEKVKVELYSESLCPYCANFIVNYLNPFFNNGIIDIVDLRIIPYGNAHVHTDGSMVCQVNVFPSLLLIPLFTSAIVYDIPVLRASCVGHVLKLHDKSYTRILFAF